MRARRSSQLARLVIEMLAPLGAAATAVAFARGPKAATAARKRWGKAVPNKVISLDGDDKKAKKSAKRRGGGGGGGFAAKLAEELAPRGSGGGGASALAVPRDAEVLLVVGALGAAELACAREHLTDEYAFVGVLDRCGAQTPRPSPFGARS